MHFSLFDQLTTTASNVTQRLEHLPRIDCLFVCFVYLDYFIRLAKSSRGAMPKPGRIHLFTWKLFWLPRLLNTAGRITCAETH
jgi:hypothetical protein